MVPEHINISHEWKLVNWYSDMQATMLRAPAKQRLRDFFEPGVGPHAPYMTLTKSQFAELARTLADEVVEEQQKKSASGPKASAVLEKSAKQRKDDLQQKAKEALQKAREDKLKRAAVAMS